PHPGVPVEDVSARHDYVGDLAFLEAAKLLRDAKDLGWIDRQCFESHIFGKTCFDCSRRVHDQIMRTCERSGFKCETYTGRIEGGSRFWCVSTHAQDPQRFSLRILETGRPLRKVEAQQNGRTLLLEEIGAVVTLGCTRDHELELEFLAECDCAPDLAHGVG